jgi:hypothetical protein
LLILPPTLLAGAQNSRTALIAAHRDFKTTFEADKTPVEAFVFNAAPEMRFQLEVKAGTNTPASLRRQAVADRFPLFNASGTRSSFDEASSHGAMEGAMTP